MNKEFKISIITPSFNSGKYIERAIRSVLKQHYKNWEHIIIDGVSTDETINILKKYKHLKWISEKDNGQSDAMNKGFRMSNGDIVVYLNADDFFFPGAFSAVVKQFKKGSKFVVGNIQINSIRLGAKSILNTPRFTLDGMIRHWEPNSFCHNPVGYFYRREVQIACPFNLKNHLSMDLEFLLDAASRYRFTKIENILGCFDDRSETKTSMSQLDLNYWQPSNFPFLNKHIKKMDLNNQIKYLADQRSGYAELQKRVYLSSYNTGKFLVNDKNTNNPLVSIIIPTYNDKKDVSRSINSALSQSYKNIEVIVIDDASKDGTFSYLKKKYRNKILLVKNKKNIKLGGSRNIGINISKGEYLFFLDSDDWIEKQTISKLVGISQRFDTDITACGIIKTYSNRSSESLHSQSVSCNGGKEALWHLAEYRIASVAWNKLYSRELIIKNKLSFITPHWHEDVTFAINSLYKCKRYISIPDEYYSYYQRESSIINGKKTLLHLRSYLRLINDVISFCEANLGKSILDKALAKRLISSHAFVDFHKNILQYVETNGSEAFFSEIEKACKIEFKKCSLLISYIISNILFKTSVDHSKTVENNLGLTRTETKLIFMSRRIKHKLIPENSKRKLIFEKFFSLFHN
jgi:glycosyltransferase involved in cell wall biosynthesis